MAKQEEQGKGEQQQKGGGELVRRGGAGRREMRPFEEMERMIESMFPRGFMRPVRFDWPFESPALATMERRVPAIDVIDHPDEIVIRAEVPGVSKDNLDISMTDSTITIRGRSEHEEKEEKEEYFRHEMSYGEFSRSVSLPADVDAEKAKATVKNGILELKLPKAEAAKPRSIRIEG